LAFIIYGFSLLCGVASLACWIITLIKVFPESVGLGVLALICPLYAFIWCWQNREKVGPMVPVVWTAVVIINIFLSVAAKMLS
jgi:hypothetical protein